MLTVLVQEPWWCSTEQAYSPRYYDMLSSLAQQKLAISTNSLTCLVHVWPCSDPTLQYINTSVLLLDLIGYMYELVQIASSLSHNQSYLANQLINSVTSSYGRQRSCFLGSNTLLRHPVSSYAAVLDDSLFDY